MTHLLRRLMLASAALILTLPGRSQPCDCKQYTGIIFLYPRSLTMSDLHLLAYLADSLDREYAYVFTVVPPESGWAGRLDQAHVRAVVPATVRHGLRLPYSVLKAGKENRIVLLDLGAWDDSTVMRALQYSWLGQKFPVFIGTGEMPLEGARVLAETVPGFQEIIGVSQTGQPDSTLFFGQVMVPVSDPSRPGIGKTTLVLNRGVIMERRDETVPKDSIHVPAARKSKYLYLRGKDDQETGQKK
jgi:hypothetical protein